MNHKPAECWGWKKPQKKENCIQPLYCMHGETEARGPIISDICGLSVSQEETQDELPGVGGH